MWQKKYRYRILWLAIFIGIASLFVVKLLRPVHSEIKYETIQPIPRSTNTYLSGDDLQFGRQQVDHMLQDRPNMSICVAKDDAVYTWAVRQFAGEATGRRIYWSSALPECQDECISKYHLSSETSTGFITIRERYISGTNKGQPLPCGRLWAAAVFELYNISNSSEINAIVESASAGMISRQEYITGIAKTEFVALQKTAQFYWKVWQPYSYQKHLETNSDGWYTDEPATYELWIQSEAPTGYPENDYGQYYDSVIKPYLDRQGMRRP